MGKLFWAVKLMRSLDVSNQNPVMILETF